ncbi:MAG: LytTR family DNA-binding domain-containing protein [Bacteroidota bacterium]|nr:LytTR family DNA-binding domain-containing protein [Bacteroidota bacterium]
MKKIKTIIVDDERHGRDNLNALLTQNCPEIEVAGDAASVLAAKELITTIQPELVFLDILMPVHNGFDLLDHFPERKFGVIFVSASVEFGIQAVKAGVLDYVLKPIAITELKSAVSKVRAYLDMQNYQDYPANQKITKIALSHSNGFSIEEIENITRLQADDNYTRVFTVSGKQYLISRPLKDFERALPPGIFIRTHKSFMINIQHLKDFKNEDGGIAILKDGVKVPVSKRKNPLFFGALKKFSLMLRP